MCVREPASRAPGYCWLPADGVGVAFGSGRGLPRKCLASALAHPSDKPRAASGASSQGFLGDGSPLPGLAVAL